MKEKVISRTVLCGALLLGIATMATPVVAFAQHTTTQNGVSQIKVAGTVKDEGGPVIGASVLEKGASNGTITDINGRFTLNVKAGGTLVVSYVGCKSTEVKALSESISVTLE